MRYTSAQAGKLIKKIENAIVKAESAESKSSVFRAALGEDVEAIRPAYDFRKAQDTMDELKAKLREVKHAVNVFNVNHTLPGFDGLTIDQALIYLPQLRQRARTLQMMAARLPRERVESYLSSGSLIDYTITNYDAEEAEEEYQKVYDLMTSLQLALDIVNSTESMEINVTL